MSSSTTTQRPIMTLNTSVIDRSFLKKEKAKQTIFKCSFSSNNNNNADCQVKFTGKDWLLTTVSDLYGNELDNYYSVQLKSSEKSELFFKDMVPKPQDGVACLSFRYKKFLKDGGSAPLQVLAWPYRGRPGKVNVRRDSPTSEDWIRAQITFRKVNNFFVILFRANSPTFKKMDIALDDVEVDDGPCV